MLSTIDHLFIENIENRPAASAAGSRRTGAWLRPERSRSRRRPWRCGPSDPINSDQPARH